MSAAGSSYQVSPLHSIDIKTSSQPPYDDGAGLGLNRRKEAWLEPSRAVVRLTPSSSSPALTPSTSSPALRVTFNHFINELNQPNDESYASRARNARLKTYFFSYFCWLSKDKKPSILTSFELAQLIVNKETHALICPLLTETITNRSKDYICTLERSSHMLKIKHKFNAVLNVIIGYREEVKGELEANKALHRILFDQEMGYNNKLRDQRHSLSKRIKYSLNLNFNTMDNREFLELYNGYLQEIKSVSIKHQKQYLRIMQTVNVVEKKFNSELERKNKMYCCMCIISILVFGGILATLIATGTIER